ncbi:MAG: hypothetical protein KDA68_17320 [Planctomycetaceae bacterium]|nr:hypothetical protein [Planctomycetaceae bacterium]
MTPQETIDQIKRKLSDLYLIDFGYPLGDNIVRDASYPNGLPDAFTSKRGTIWLTSLYSACDGLSLPDVHNGYFLKPLVKVASIDRSSEPDTIAGNEEEIEVLPFGSTGNGSLFVVDCQRGAVLLLSPGHMSGGRYDGERGKVTEVAATVPQFLERLFRDVHSFINGDNQHNYIS